MLIFIIILLSSFSFIYGVLWCDWFEYVLEINAFKSPFYRLGISFEPLQEEKDIIWRFTLGLIVINIVLSFGKTIPLNDTKA